ncbi:SDR family NAD(P)-dependent oxidoreductase [Aliicoccus persicus]|uniref:SDR family NAD(P)-dependent oxidoreductase n=1 Tax=Aliicoccus persicus TaxID=930138 RepID=UPI002481B014|nr:SDR family oxidoreductase [Aliicoccus persicus]
MFGQVDVSDEASVEHMVKATVDHYGTLDIAINNAAITPDDKPLTETDFEYWDKLMAVDLKGVALSLKYELRQFEKEGNVGSIVNTPSASEVRPQPANSAYVAAKYSVIGLTKNAAMDYLPKGIRINTVAPVAIDTPMLRGAIEQCGLEPDSYAKQLSMLGRFAQAEEVAQTYLWLASDGSSYVTGAVINVDGGYT